MSAARSAAAIPAGAPRRRASGAISASTPKPASSAATSTHGIMKMVSNRIWVTPAAMTSPIAPIPSSSARSAPGRRASRHAPAAASRTPGGPSSNRPSCASPASALRASPPGGRVYHTGCDSEPNSSHIRRLSGDEKFPGVSPNWPAESSIE